MKIALFGATGAIGRNLLQEALDRNHDVTAIVRDPSRLTVSHPQLAIVQGDITDSGRVADLVRGHDAVIASISGRRDGDAGQIVAAARALIDALPKADVLRLLWVGGAGSLEIAPGVRLVDAPNFPEAYRAEALAQAETLELFRGAGDPLAWSFLSPAAVIGPGERTGTFRLGGDQLLSDPEGNSRISTEDFAVALLDEVETPTHIRRRFTVAY